MQITRPPRLITFTIRVPLYPFRVLFLVGPRPHLHEYRRIVHRAGISRDPGAIPAIPEDAYSTCAHFPNASAVWFPATDPTPEFFDQFSHELIHVISNFHDVIGHKSSLYADEPTAYFAGWLAKEFVRQIIGRRGRLDSRR